MNTLLVACAHCGALNRIPQSRLAERPKCGRCKHGVFEARPVELDAANFDNHVLRGDLPVLVDFWAPWCGPCQMMAPVFEQAARQLEPGVRLAKLNTEEQPSLAGGYAIRSIPTMILFIGGREVARQSGAMPLGMLLDWVRQHTGLHGSPG